LQQVTIRALASIVDFAPETSQCDSLKITLEVC
jgi:hypothetical protein